MMILREVTYLLCLALTYNNNNAGILLPLQETFWTHLLTYRIKKRPLSCREEEITSLPRETD
jgi:hypothetical protein